MGRVLSELRIDDPRDVVGMTRKKGGGRESDTSGEASPTRVASPPRESQDAPRPQTPARRWDYHGAGLAQADDSGGNRDTPPDEAAGGGRESGRPDPGGADSTPQGSHEPEAAADPAACSLCGEIHLNPYLRTHAERIRALEAELVFLGRHNFECPAQALLEKAEARVKELEAHCCVKTRGGEYWARKIAYDMDVGRDRIRGRRRGARQEKAELRGEDRG